MRRAVWTAEGTWRVTDGTGREQAATLGRDPTVSEAFVILRLRGEDGVPRTMLLSSWVRGVAVPTTHSWAGRARGWGERFSNLTVAATR